MEDISKSIEELMDSDDIQELTKFLEERKVDLSQEILLKLRELRSQGCPFNKEKLLQALEQSNNLTTFNPYDHAVCMNNNLTVKLPQMNENDVPEPAKDDFWRSCIQEIIHIIETFDGIEYVLDPNEKQALQVLPNYVNGNGVLKEVLVNFSTKYCDIKALQDNNEENSTDSEKLIEYALKATCWKTLYHLFENIPENQIESNKEIRDLRDKIVVNMLNDDVVADPYKYIHFITETSLRRKILMRNMKRWPGKFCIEALRSEIANGDADELSRWLASVELSEKVKKLLDLDSWWSAYELCENDRERVYVHLIEHSELKTIVSFNKFFELSKEVIERTSKEHVFKLLEVCNETELIASFLDLFSKEFSISTCCESLKRIKNIRSLFCIVRYLSENVQDERLKYIEVSLKMLSEFDEYEQFLTLLPEPLDIIEVLIMNTKFDKLSTALNTLKNEVLHFEYEKLSIENIDEVLRTYANKSLDFRVVTSMNLKCLRARRDGRFVMPVEVPDKEKWVPNNEVVECMGCQKVAFSMFNRRHHCRRCGRVICYNCSQQRMLVPTYGEVLVRVCSDCYNQTVRANDMLLDTNNATLAKSGYWFFTDDPERNKIIRQEFSYEQAPSVSLCLSIMKHHSKNIEYPKFLLEQCNVMLRLLQPGQEPSGEIDYLLVIKMLKSVALAAKMASQEGNLHYGTSLADNILLQADLLHMLVERGCLNLLPVHSNYPQNPYIDASVMRKLRDRLLEEEQWNLALEVSTKTGLDNTGVFAAWGKACLKVGCLELAREKFQRCLDKTIFYESLSDHSILTVDSLDERKGNLLRSGSSSSLESKPMKDPPLLKEIISILESNLERVPPEVIYQLEKRRASVSSLERSSVLNRIKNLKNQNVDQASMPDIFYDESIFYLSRYGTHLSLIKFLIKHGDLHKALHYLIDTHLGADVFVDIYMTCVKNGITDSLLANMSAIDSTLDTWKVYLRHLCRHLEKQKLLHPLYHLQQFMGDYIRAAMTCIRFYQKDARDFTGLLNNGEQLKKAEEHLRHVLEQEQWVDVAPVRKHSSTSKEGFVEKAITHPTLVMKMSRKEIDRHISTIARQEEIVKFFAQCEEDGKKPIEILNDMIPSEDVKQQKEEVSKVPTLFGSNREKVNIAVLAVVSASSIEVGFSIASSIVADFNVKPSKVYCQAGKQLAKYERYDAIVHLVNCLKQTNSNDDKAMNDICDEMLASAVVTFTKANVSGTRVEDLIKLIVDLGTKISAYIEAKQLKTAYYLAVKYKRMSHVRRIMKEAELLNQPSIKALCQKVLQNHSHNHSKE